jgi:hypothetical protein
MSFLASVRRSLPLRSPGVADPKAFRSGRNFSAWIELVLAVADLRSAKSLFTKVQSWFSSTHILAHNESVPNEPHRYTL